MTGVSIFMYSTLFPLMNILPYLAIGSPLFVSSASAKIRFIQLSHLSRIPMYSCPLFSLTKTLLFMARLRSFKGSLRKFAPHNPCLSSFNLTRCYI